MNFVQIADAVDCVVRAAAAEGRPLEAMIVSDDVRRTLVEAWAENCGHLRIDGLQSFAGLQVFPPCLAEGCERTIVFLGPEIETGAGKTTRVRSAFTVVFDEA